MNAADRLRATLIEDGWGEGSLAMGQLDDALSEARAQVEDECVARGHLTGADLAAIRAQGAAAERERIRTAVYGLTAAGLPAGTRLPDSELTVAEMDAILDEVSA